VALSRTPVRNRNGGLRAVVRGSLAGVAGALALAAFGTPDAHAYVVKKTSRGELVHWEERTVTIALDASLEANVPDAVAATRHAMADWSGTVGAPEILEVGGADAPTKPGFDQKNGVFYMPKGYAPAGRALAVTVLTYDNATGRILDSDVIFNGAYKFAVLESQVADQTKHTTSGTRPSATDGITHDEREVATDNVYDLHHVIAHELGHTLGMNDEMDRKDALMYRYSAPNDATMRAPASDDIAGLAELYATKIEAGGSGCGNATVAPKKPSHSASQLALVATLGFLAFLVLRGRSDRRARFAFVAAAAVAAYALLPSVSTSNAGVARASELAPGHARAKVLAATTTMEDGLFKTTYKLATTACRTASCPKLGHGAAWGGTSGNIRQEVGGQFAPTAGEDVDVSFAKLPSAIAPLTQPLGAPRSTDEAVTVLTRAE